jgi:hypothetical protein
VHLHAKKYLLGLLVILTNVEMANSESLSSLMSAEIAMIRVLLVMVQAVAIALDVRMLSNFSF